MKTDPTIIYLLARLLESMRTSKPLPLKQGGTEVLIEIRRRLKMFGWVDERDAERELRKHITEVNEGGTQ